MSSMAHGNDWVNCNVEWGKVHYEGFWYRDIDESGRRIWQN